MYYCPFATVSRHFSNKFSSASAYSSGVFWALPENPAAEDVYKRQLLALAAVVGIIVYWIALESAVKTALQRKESILDELGRSDGPLSTA